MGAREDLEMLCANLADIAARNATRRIWSYFPPDGPFRRDLYPKHMEFFRAGEAYRERCFMAANRIGKTEGAGGYETTLHLTGLYDAVAPWWEGKRFDRPIRAWAAGKTNETTRDIVQSKLFGPVVGSGATKSVAGTGLIPGGLIGEIRWKQGVPDLIDYATVRHVNGEDSVIGLKSYQQGRGAFEGTEQDIIWLDEEPPIEVYGECLIRTATTNGLIYMTFTPLDGMTEVATSFLPGGKIPEDNDACGI